MNMIFKKTYTVDVEIDLEEAHNDPEWAVEDWEIDNAGALLSQIYDDVEEFIRAEGLD